MTSIPNKPFWQSYHNLKKALNDNEGYDRVMMCMDYMARPVGDIKAVMSYKSIRIKAYSYLNKLIKMGER